MSQIKERKEMPTYVMLTNLTSEGVKTVKSHPGRVAVMHRTRGQEHRAPEAAVPCRLKQPQ